MLLPEPITLQGLKAIARRRPWIIQPSGDFELPQFAPRHRGDARETSDANPSCERLGIGAFE
jgi:hypothetical protein